MAVSKLAAAPRHFVIPDTYLDIFKESESAYFDIQEVKNGTGHFHDWVLSTTGQNKIIDPDNSNPWEKQVFYKITSSELQRMADFRVFGVKCGDIDSEGNEINAMLWDEYWKDIHQFASTIMEPVRIRRIYPMWTTARKIRLYGNIGNE